MTSIVIFFFFFQNGRHGKRSNSDRCEMSYQTIYMLYQIQYSVNILCR